MTRVCLFTEGDQTRPSGPDPPEPEKWAVHILLECILVKTFFRKDTVCQISALCMQYLFNYHDNRLPRLHISDAAVRIVGQ